MRSGSLAALLRQPPRTWGLLAETVWCLILVEVGLRVSSLPRLLILLGPGAHPQPRQRRHAPAIEEALRVAAAVFRRYPSGASCLKRSLVLRALLARRGLPVELKIGVARPDQHLRAHAWLEHGGRPLLEPEDPARTYPAVLSLDPAA